MLFGDNMDYYNHSCPVCSEKFKNGDDTVVCPICGTPHHRECYERHGNCFFADKHSEGFNYKDKYGTNASDNSDNNNKQNLVCQYCGKENREGDSFCSGCSMPLSHESHQTQPFTSPYQAQTPPPSGHQGPQRVPNATTFVLDPLGGVAPETDIGDGITAGEAAKYVKSNTPFYTRLFYQIKVFGKSRFSFVGFFFTGIWMLYRKMYLAGALVTALLFGTMFANIFLSYAYTSFLTGALAHINELLNSSAGTNAMANLSDVGAYFMSLNTEYQIILGSYFLISFLQFVLKVVCGLCANRWYYKHCKKQITKIKKSADSKAVADKELQTMGGVNLALTISIVVSYLAINYLPSMLFGG